MLLEKLDSQALLWITTLVGKTTTPGLSAFRGDLVLIEGAMREGSNNIRDRKTPELVINQAAILADSDKILFINGLFYKLEHIRNFVEKYGYAISPATVAVLYVENIASPMQIEYEGVTFKLLPYREGMVWNETLEALYIEKADLKGQSGEDKVITLYEAAKDFKIKTPPITLEEGLTQTIEVKKDLAVGPV
ncbi:MAG: hypothetical protein PHW13_02695 [Methylococcales bacterium]|nr:hypothetical protein [Methylococcales bacterium]